MTIGLGSKVCWQSSAAGTTKTKVGEVVHVVAPGEPPLANETAEKLGAMSEYGHGSPRDHESYLVLVLGKTKRSKPKLYWPLAGKLQLWSSNNEEKGTVQQ